MTLENINSPFLAEKGITDTQASRVADYAKLAYTELETEINNIKLYSTSIEKLDSKDVKVISYGLTADKMLDIPEKVERIGNLKALCAWLREAIKEHQTYISKAQTYRFSDYLKDMNISMSEAPNLESTITEQEVLDSFDIKKRALYYSLEAHAATVGQVVHKGQSLDAARKAYYDAKVNPRKVDSLNSETIIYTKTLSVEDTDVESLFYKLQQKQGEYQSQYNALRTEIMSRITNDSIDKRKAYNEKMAAHEAESEKYMGEYALYTQQMQKKIGSLKIVIPNSLQDIYNEISQLGKKVD